MNKSIWFTFFSLCLSSVVAAQQSADVAVLRRPLQESEGGSIFSDFSCVVKNSNSVDLQWKAAGNEEGDYFVVERSTDGGDHYETLSVLKVADSTTALYELVDNSPVNGIDFYRIRYTGKSGKNNYSKTIPVSLSADVDFKFYPNPADKLLIIRTAHHVQIDILDPGGAVRLSKDIMPGLQVVNVSALDKGSYVLRIADKQSNRVLSEQFLKN